MKHLLVVGVIKVFKEIQVILETGEWFIIDFESSLFILYIKIIYFCASNNLVSYFAFIYLIYNTILPKLFLMKDQSIKLDLTELQVKMLNTLLPKSYKLLPN